MRESLRLIREEGLENVYGRIETLARATREGAKALGLSIFAKSPSPAVTAIVAPDGIDGQAIYKTFWKKYGVTGAGGQDQSQGQNIQDRYTGLRGQVRRDHRNRRSGVRLEGPRVRVPDGQGVAAATVCLKDA